MGEHHEGMPEGMADFVVAIPFNDLAAFECAVAAHRDEPAAVILEPISYNMGCIPADTRLSPWVRRIRTERSIVLIFDEEASLSHEVGRAFAQRAFRVAKIAGLFRPGSRLPRRQEVEKHQDGIHQKVRERAAQDQERPQRAESLESHHDPGGDREKRRPT